MSSEHKTEVAERKLEAVELAFQSPIYEYLQLLEEYHIYGEPTWCKLSWDEYDKLVYNLTTDRILYMIHMFNHNYRLLTFREMENGVTRFNNSWNVRLVALISKTVLPRNLRDIVLSYFA
jgi:hypothetical protein